MSANNTQVGGEHYRTTIQHWDFAAANELDYFQGQITKYVTRWKKKNGLEDLLKAQHFLAKYVELVRAGAVKFSGGKVEENPLEGVKPFDQPYEDPGKARRAATEPEETLTPHPSHNWLGGKSTMCKRCGAFKNLPSGTRPCVRLDPAPTVHTDPLLQEVLELKAEVQRGVAARNELQRMVDQLRMMMATQNDEILRLKAGKFTEEELQNLCHEQGEDCPERFAQGCVDYNRKLFGDRNCLRLRGEGPDSIVIVPAQKLPAQPAIPTPQKSEEPQP